MHRKKAHGTRHGQHHLCLVSRAPPAQSPTWKQAARENVNREPASSGPAPKRGENTVLNSVSLVKSVVHERFLRTKEFFLLKALALSASSPSGTRETTCNMQPNRAGGKTPSFPGWVFL
uniref:Uncharacterized protein n=1 Tax=Noctiluca scintillans TaxID=2966 RepID=A0A7S1F9X2_NOCSC|mmetsp:Transcript_43423/g.114437  ORF Transcript_43423/g.114437 Transcript_43423/m.114437 type:complete len:119 (+) Transcript_43423:158-514(+)